MPNVSPAARVFRRIRNLLSVFYRVASDVRTIVMETITREADLNYVDKKLKRWLVENALAAQRKPVVIGAKTSRESFSVDRNPKTVSNIQGSANITTVVQSTSGSEFDRVFVSPDSRILCSDNQCPITTPHNLGRFYHDGQRAESPVDSDFETRLGNSMNPVSHFFNYTVPPPDINEAYLRMVDGQATFADADIVRRYKMNHCWSPVVSEYPSPRPESPNAAAVSIQCLVLPTEKASKKQQELLFEQLEAYTDDEVENLVHPAFRDNLKDHIANGQMAGDFHGVKRSPVPPRKSTERVKCSKQAVMMDDNVCEQPKLKLSLQTEFFRQSQRTRTQLGHPYLRRMPKGENLREVQHKLQESIVDKITEQAIGECNADCQTETKILDDTTYDTTNSPGAESILSAESDEGPQDVDRELEVLAALMKKLKQSLDDGSFRDFGLLDRQSKDFEVDAKYKFLSDVLLIVRMAFQQLLREFDRSFRPTGMEVKYRELEEVFEEYLMIYETLLERYSLMTPQEIAKALDRKKHHANMEKV